MLDLPGHNGWPIAIALDHPRHEGAGRLQQPWLCSRSDQGAFNEGVTPMVDWHKEFRIAKVLDRTDAQDDLFTSLFSRLDLPVKLIRAERTWRWLALLPVGAKAQHLKRVCQQGGQSRLRIQAERLDLARAQADAQQRCAAGGNWPLPPAVGQGLSRARQAHLDGKRQGRCAGGSNRGEAPPSAW